MGPARLRVRPRSERFLRNPLLRIPHREKRRRFPQRFPSRADRQRKQTSRN